MIFLPNGLNWRSCLVKGDSAKGVVLFGVGICCGAPLLHTGLVRTVFFFVGANGDVALSIIVVAGGDAGIADMVTAGSSWGCLDELSRVIDLLKRLLQILGCIAT